MRTTALIKIICLSLLGLFTSCAEKDDDSANCQISIDYILEDEGDKTEITLGYLATGLESDSDITYSWSVNGIETIETNAEFIYTFVENGTYDICVFSETPECPRGVEFCKEVIIDEIVDDIDSDCDLTFMNILPNEEGDNSKVVAVYLASGLESDSDIKYFWSVNGTNANENSNEFKYTFLENGTYEICVFTETPECPRGVEYCKQITIDSIENSECPKLEIDKNLISNDAKKYLLKAISDSNSTNFYWTIVEGDSVLMIDRNSDNSEIYYEFLYPGTYKVCAQLLNPGCDTTILECLEIIVE